MIGERSIAPGRTVRWSSSIDIAAKCGALGDKHGLSADALQVLCVHATPPINEMFWSTDYGGDREPARTTPHNRLKAAYEELSVARVLQPAGATVSVRVWDGDAPNVEHLHTYRLTHQTRVFLNEQ
jgi:hypothetical protein